jgi:SAM-dependent methyltransferase
MPLNELKLNGTIYDESFDLIFPEAYRLHSNRHFTSVYIAQRAVQFLNEHGAKTVLDIGSATGKFCLVAAVTKPDIHFTGIEYRADQVAIANACVQQFELTNVTFECANILTTSFAAFDGFYMFNPFLENKDASANMDGEKLNSETAANQYVAHVMHELDQRPIGTPLVTYWTPIEQIPSSYELQQSNFGDTLKFWLKSC